MNGRSGFRGVGYGFKNIGRPASPSLGRVFQEALDVGRLFSRSSPMKPAMEKIVSEYAAALTRKLGRYDDSYYEMVEHFLRNFSEEIESAEGEDPREIER